MQLRLLHDASAYDDQFGREHARPVVHRQREVVPFELPGGMRGCQFGRRTSPARLHSWPARQAFEAVAVEGAAARVWIEREIVRDADVAHLRMFRAINEL